MTYSGKKKTAFFLAALAASTALAAQPASAKNIFQMIFGDGNQLHHTEHGAFPKAPPPPRGHATPRVSVPKVTGPSYYDYKAEELVSVDFAPIRQTADFVASVDDTDAAAAPMSEKASFRSALGGLADFDLTTEKKVAAALTQYYSQNPAFIWVSAYGANERAVDAMKVLGDASSYGLDTQDYEVEAPSDYFLASRMEARRAALMRFEMTLSARVLRYAMDASRGRVAPNKLSGYHDFPDRPVDLVAVLKSLSGQEDLQAFLEGQHPQNADYRTLRQDLAILRASEKREISVRSDLLLHPGESDPDFPKIVELIHREGGADINAQFGELLAANAGNETYALEMEPVIKAAQKARSLRPDGVIGPRTVHAFAGESKASRIAKVEMALERLRWLPSNLGNPHVTINAAAFTAAFVQDDKDRLKMRTVVGRTTNQTSFFYDEIEYVEFNPYWGVPRSIIINEMLPRLLRDPGYLDRAGYEVTDAKGRHIPSASIDWGRYGAKIPYNVRQVPSEENALGELKIMFPNKNAIYMHDTPSKSLFNRDMRAFSHGCVRLQHPREMAAAVLDWSVPQVADRLKGGHSRQNVPHKIPVYVGYFTAWPDSDGSVAFYGDIYGRDGKLQAALEKIEAVRAPSVVLAKGD